MRSIARLFYAAPELTRYDSYVELTKIRELIKQLKAKELELSNAMASAGIGSKDFRKHSVLSDMLAQIDAHITVFNTAPEPQSREQRLQLLSTLIQSIHHTVDTTISNHREALNTFRNNYKYYAQDAVMVTGFTATVMALYLAPISFMFKPFLFAAAVPNIDEAMHHTSLYKNTSKTMYLLLDLYSELRSAADNVNTAINPNRPPPVARVVNNQRINNNNNQPAADLLHYSPAMDDYVAAFNHRSSVADLLEELALTPAEEDRLERFLDPILMIPTNRPVLLEGQVFDLNSLLTLPENNHGARKNPLNNRLFYLRDLQPAREFYQNLLTEIETIRRDRVAVQQPAPDVPPQSPSPGSH